MQINLSSCRLELQIIISCCLSVIVMQTRQERKMYHMRMGKIFGR